MPRSAVTEPGTQFTDGKMPHMMRCIGEAERVGTKQAVMAVSHQDPFSAQRVQPH